MERLREYRDMRVKWIKLESQSGIIYTERHESFWVGLSARGHREYYRRYLFKVPFLRVDIPLRVLLGQRQIENTSSSQKYSGKTLPVAD